MVSACMQCTKSNNILTVPPVPYSFFSALSSPSWMEDAEAMLTVLVFCAFRREGMTIYLVTIWMCLSLKAARAATAAL